MIQSIPLYPEPFYTYSVDIENDAYQLTFRYSNRANAYLMDIEDAEGVSVIRGVKLLTYVPLLAQYSLEVFNGDFLLIPKKESPVYDSEPTNQRELYKTHTLLYVTIED